MEEKLQRIVAETKEKRLDDIGFNTEDYNSKTDALMGRCKTNSKQLVQRVKSAGYEARVGAGLIGSDIWVREENLPDSFEEAVHQRHPIHYWVEVGPYVCEIASESDSHYGESIVKKVHPDKLGYITFPDNYQGFEKQDF